MSGIAFALLCLIWSTTWAAIRACEQGFSPLWGAAFRFALAATILSLASLKRGSRARDIPFWWLPTAGLVNAISYSLIYLAEQRLTGGTAAVLGATNPFFTLAAAVALGYERIVWGRTLGLVVGFVGVCILFQTGFSFGHATVLAMTEILGAAALLWPTYTVLLRKAGDAGFSGLPATASFIRWTAVFLWLGAFTLEGRPHAAGGVLPVGALLYLAIVGTAVAWWLFVHLLERLPMTVLSTMLFIEPALALVVDWFLGEKAPSRNMWIGIVFVLAGVVLSTLRLANGRRPILNSPLSAETGP